MMRNTPQPCIVPDYRIQSRGTEWMRLLIAEGLVLSQEVVPVFVKSAKAFNGCC